MSDTNRHLPFGERAKLWFRRLGLIVVGYVKKFHLKKGLAPWNFLQRVWSMGWGMRIVVVLFVVFSILAGWLMKWQSQGHGEVSPWLELLPLAFFAIMWATAAAAASELPVWTLLLATPWFVQLSILALSAVARTPLMAAPSWLILILGWWRCAALSSRWQGFLWWAMWSAAGGYFTSGPSGFRHAVGLDVTQGQLAAGLIYFVIGGGLLWWRTRKSPLSPPRFSQVLAISLPLISVLLAVACWKDRALTLEWVPEQFNLIDIAVFTFWVWTGGETALGAWKTVDWATTQLARLNLTRVCLWLIPFLWVVGAIIEWWVAGGAQYADWVPTVVLEKVGLPLMTFGSHYPLHRLACHWHFWITLSLLIAMMWLMIRRRLRARFWLRGMAFWLVSFGLIIAYFSSQQIAIDANEGRPKLDPLAFAFMALLTMARLEKDWGKVGDGFFRAQIGWMTAVIASVMTARLVQGDKAMASHYMYLFFGLLFLGPPFTLYSRLSRGDRSEERIPTFHQAVLALAGAICGLAVLYGKFQGPRSWALLAVLWTAILSLLAWRFPQWNRIAGAMAGSLLAAGTMFYYVAPFVIDLPFLGAVFPVPPQSMPFHSHEEQIATVLGVIGAGWLLGWLVFRAFPRDRYSVALPEKAESLSSSS